MTKNHLSLIHIFQESRYDLVGVICHHGTAGGGHYTAYSLNNNDQEWYENYISLSLVKNML